MRRRPRALPAYALTLILLAASGTAGTLLAESQRGWSGNDRSAQARGPEQIPDARHPGQLAGGSAVSGDEFMEIALGVTSRNERLSQLGRSVAALSDGGFAVVWFARIEPWQDRNPNSCDIRMQWISPAGKPRFRRKGFLVARVRDCYDPVVIPAPGGGAFVGFLDFHQVRVQRFTEGGRPAWSRGGVKVIENYQRYESHHHPDLTSDANGGVIVCVATLNPGGISCQHLDETGRRLWGDFGQRTVAEDSQWSRHLRGVPDGEGGLLIFWALSNTGRKPLSGEGRKPLILGQRFTADGERLWPNEGLLVRKVNIRNGSGRFGAVSDGYGGAVIAYTDRLSRRSRAFGVAAQRVRGDGRLLWAPSTVVRKRKFVDEQVVAAGDGGAYVIVDEWNGNRLRVHRLGPGGKNKWGPKGLPVSSPENRGLNYNASGSYGRGVLRIGWTEQQPGPFTLDIKYKRFTRSGRRLDPPEGVALSDSAGDQFLRGLVYSPASNAVFAAWNDLQGKNWKDMDVRGVLRVEDPSAH